MRIFTEEHKQKISNANKGKHNSPKTEFQKGQKHPNYGKHLSDEIKLKISEANKGKSGSPKTVFKKGHLQFNTGRTWFKKGMTSPRKDIHLSIETKNKISSSKKGQIPWNKGLKEYLSKDKNPQWKGGLTPINELLRKSDEYKKWRKLVYERDYFTCQHCKIKQKYLIAHHIKSWENYPKLRYKIANGITLCRSCHKKIHKKIGINTRFGQSSLNFS